MKRPRPAIYKIVLALTCLHGIGCVTGPKRENDSALDYLNGRNYQAGSQVSGVPLVRRQAPATTVSGVLLVDADPLPLPLKYQAVVLSLGGREIARAMTDSKGEFTLAGDISNGAYSVALDSARYALSHPLQVSSDKTEGLCLVARAR
jgi:hypothetical protein